MLKYSLFLLNQLFLSLAQRLFPAFTREFLRAKIMSKGIVLLKSLPLKNHHPDIKLTLESSGNPNRNEEAELNSNKRKTIFNIRAKKQTTTC